MTHLRRIPYRGHPATAGMHGIYRGVYHREDPKIENIDNIYFRIGENTMTDVILDEPLFSDDEIPTELSDLTDGYYLIEEFDDE